MPYQEGDPMVNVKAAARLERSAPYANIVEEGISKRSKHSADSN